MNIFALDKDPVKAAHYHCDKHVVKMILETAQILCTVLESQGISAPYRPTHKNHPCIKWAGKSTGNYYWLCILGMALCGEYHMRYGKEHKSLEVIVWASLQKPLFQKLKRTKFVLAMPDDCKDMPTRVQCYRKYYINYKKGIARWEKSVSKPYWYQ